MRGEHVAGRWGSAAGVRRGRVIPLLSFTWASEYTGVETDAGFSSAGLARVSSDFFLLHTLEDSLDSLLDFLKNQHQIIDTTISKVIMCHYITNFPSAY